MRQTEGGAVQRWPRKFGQSDKWLLCFTIQAEEPNTGAKA